MLEYELNGKIYTEDEINKAAGGKDKAAEFIKSKGYKLVDKNKKSIKQKSASNGFGEDTYKQVFGFENPKADEFPEISKSKKKSIEKYNVKEDAIAKNIAKYKKPTYKYPETPEPEEWKGIITPEELANEESTVAETIGKKLSKYGLIPEETTFGLNRITLRGANKNPLGKKVDMAGNELEIDLEPVITGKDLSREELELSAKKLNDYIESYGNKNFIQDAKKKNPTLIAKFENTISPKSRTPKEKLQLYTKELETEFQDKENAIKDKYKLASNEDKAMGANAAVAPKTVNLSEKDFDKPEKYSAYKAWKKTGQIPLPSTQNLENFIGEYNDNYRNSKASEFMSYASPEERIIINALTTEREENAIKEAAYLKEKGPELDKRGKDFSIKVAELQKGPQTQETIDEITKEYLALQNDTAEYNKKILSTKKDFNSIKAVYNTALKDYNRLNQAGSLLKQTGLSIIGAASDINASIKAAVAPGDYTTNKSILKSTFLDPIYEEQKAVGKELESYQQDLQIKDVKSMKDLGRWGAGVLTQMPSSMAMAVTGEAALPLFFLSGYGSKQYDIAKSQEDALSRMKYNNYRLENGQVAPDEMNEVQKQMIADKKTLNISEGAKITSQLLAGASEVLFEKYGTLGIIKETDNILRSIPKQEIKQQIVTIGKEMGKSVPIEAWTEGLTQFSNNWGDIYFLGQDKNYFDGVPDSMAGGAFMGPGFSAMGGGSEIGKNITKAVVSEITSKKEFRARQDKLKEIQRLTGLDDITGLTKREVNKLKLQEPVRKAVEELVDQIDKEDLRILDRLGKDLSMEDAKKIGDFNQKLRKITKDWNEASKTAGLDDAQLKSLRDYYQKQYNDAFNAREAMLTDDQLAGKTKKDSVKKRVIFEATEGSNIYNYRLTRKTYLDRLAGFNQLSSEEKQKYNDLAIAELTNGKPDTQIDNKQVEQKAASLYAGEEISNQLDRDIEAANDFAEETGLNVKVEAVNSEKELLDKYGKILTKEQLNELIDGSTNAFNIDDSTLIVYKPNAIKNGHTSSGSHEVLHTLLSKAFKGNQEEANKNGVKLLEYLKTAQPSLYAAVEQRMKAYKPEYSAYGEEIFNALSDSFSDGEIPKDDVFTQISKAVYRITKGKFGSSEVFDIDNLDTNSGKALFDAIKGYNQKAGAKKTKTGQNVRFIYSNTEDELGSTNPSQTGFRASKSKVAEVQQKIDKLEDQFDNDEIEYDDYTSRLEVLENELEKAKAIPEEAPKPEVKKVEVSDEEADKEVVKSASGSVSSDKVQTIYTTKGLNGAQDIIDLFKPIVKKLVNRRMDAPGFDRELLTDEIETGVGGILDLIKKYDPKSGVPLAAYINKYLPVRAIAASRRVLDKDFSKDVTEEKGLMAQETVSEVKEKPKYKNALESNVFEPEVLKTLSDKIITVTRTLKNRIDAPITLNRTVTPLISEIKDEVGRLLDIDIKAAMGGKKDDQLKKWLLKNKRYILENMTTTWLMGKDGIGGMPQAIQKQIDGRWVSYPDWVGKKIDREKTTTDQAGRTSGAELVRRLPNVNNNISNDVYLAQVLEPSGNPIRGRKESLAKAIAEESAFDIINNDLENQGPIYDAFSTNQERLGYEVTDAFANEIARQVDRGNIKFSKTLKSELSEKLGGDINDQEVVNIIRGIISQIIQPTIYKRKLGFFDIEQDWKNKLGNDLYEKIYNEYLSPIADALDTVQNSPSNKRGDIAEDKVIDTIKNIKNKDFKLISVKSAGAGSHAIDVQFSYKDVPINFEVKSGKSDRLTSLNIHNYTNNNITTSRVVSESNKDNIISQIKNNNKFQKFIKKALDNGATLTSNGSLEVDSKLLNKLKLGGSIYGKTLIPLNIDTPLIEDIYNRKGVNYIGFGDIGIFSVGENTLGLDVPKLEGKLYSKAFLHPGILKANGKTTLTLKIYTQLTTEAGNILAEKSKDSVYSPESWDNLFKNIPDSRISYIKNIPNIEKNNNTIEAITKSFKPSKTVKGISVFDFDDTIGLTNSNVLYPHYKDCYL